MGLSNHNSLFLNRLSQSWAETSEKKKMYYVYTLLFLCTSVVSFSPFILGGRSFICQFDGRETIFQDILFTGIWVRRIISNILHGSFVIPLYDLSRGWGSSTIGIGLDPLAMVLAPLFPVSYAEILYSLMIVLRLYFAGLAFLYLCRFFRKDRISSLTGCFVYLFSAYTIYSGLAFPGYIDPMIQLPLLIVGGEKIMRRERSIGFIFTVMYIGIRGYYHLYIQTILLAIYCLVRLFSLYPEKKWLKVLPGILWSGISKYLLGIGLSAWVLMPAVFGFGSTGRSSFRNLNISSELAIHWKAFWKRLIALISPVTKYDWDWGMDYPAFAAIFLLCAVAVIVSRKAEKKTLKWLLLIGLVMLFCPWCGWIMNGFQYACNRWSFGLALLAGYLVTDASLELFSMERKQKTACFAAIIAYGCISFFSPYIRSELFASVGTAFLACTMLIFVYNRGVTGTENKRQKSLLCLGLVCLNVCVNALFLCSPESMGWSNWFSKRYSESDRLTYAVESEPASSPFGYEITDGRIDSTLLYYNNSVVYGQPGLDLYTPLMNNNIVDFWNAIEGSGNIQYFKIYSSDQRTILNTLLSVDQQFEWNNSVQYVPYGYHYCGDTYLGNKVFQNEYSLGWGYTYDRSVPYEATDNLNGIDLQELMLQAVVLDQDKQITQHNAEIQIENERLPYAYECDGCTWEDGVLTVGEAGGMIQMVADLPAGAEYYMRLKGFNIDGYGDNYLTISTNASFDIAVQCGNVQKTSRVMDKAYPWYYGRDNYLFCLGYQNEDRSFATIFIPAEGTFRLEDIELFALPLEHYPERAEKLRNEQLENIVFDTNTISGTVDVTSNKVLCLTVPYEKGWTAYVDGAKADILKANYAFMGLNLTEGHHEIRFVYRPLYLNEGIITSFVCAVLTLGILLVSRKKHM